MTEPNLKKLSGPDAALQRALDPGDDHPPRAGRAAGLELELSWSTTARADGSWEELQRLAGEDPRIRAFRHERNRGKGARHPHRHRADDRRRGRRPGRRPGIRPHDYLRLLVPILDGRADAVFGSRFAGDTHRVLYFWHSVGNNLLTLLSNMVNNVNLTDMETCYKMVRADVLSELRLQSNTFTLEPEITCRLAQWGARIYEVPISYSGRTYFEGKKIKAIDGVKVFWELFRCRWLDPQFTHHRGFYLLKSIARARNTTAGCSTSAAPGSGRGSWRPGPASAASAAVAEPLAAGPGGPRPACSSRGCRTSSASGQRPRDPGRREQAAADRRYWQDERLDTVLCSGVLEHVAPGRGGAAVFHDSLEPGGHCIVVVPAEMWLYTGMDRRRGHHRRYSPEELREKMEEAGFEVVLSRRVVCSLAALAWWLAGRIFRQHQVSARQLIWFDRLFPLTRCLDFLIPVPGMSLIMVGKKAIRVLGSRLAPTTVPGTLWRSPVPGSACNSWRLSRPAVLAGYGGRKHVQTRTVTY